MSGQVDFRMSQPSCAGLVLISSSRHVSLNNETDRFSRVMANDAITGIDGPGVQTFNGKDPKVLDAVHQAIPEQVAQPLPIYFGGLTPSPNGECKSTPHQPTILPNTPLTQFLQAAAQLASHAPAPNTASAVAPTATAATVPNTAAQAAKPPLVSALHKARCIPVMQVPSLSLCLLLQLQVLLPRPLLGPK
jgi:hypothetical protein